MYVRDTYTHHIHRTVHLSIPLANPLDHSVVFSCECSNTRHFIIPALTDSQVDHTDDDICEQYTQTCSSVKYTQALLLGHA